MKKLLLTIYISITVLLIMPLCGDFSLTHADSDYYPIACPIDEFEVSKIKDDGIFEKVSCHSHFENAKNKMKENDDYVVRYDKSYSPSKIVAMNSGLVYTYPGRKGSAIMRIFQNYNTRDNDSRYKSTIVSNHYEMTYVDTLGPEVYDIKANGKGYIKVVLNGFEGYTDIEYTDLVPSKFIKNGIPIYLGGKNSYEDEDPFKVICKQNYYEIKTNGNYNDLVFHYHRAYPSRTSNDCLSYEIKIDNATNYLNAGMVKDTKYYSNDGVNFYSDPKLKNFVARVYNYYQFLPLRSKTSVNADVLDSFLVNIQGSNTNSLMKNTGSLWIKYQDRYGCNALITYAMGCLESSYGTSDICLESKNLFGWNAVDENPGSATDYDEIKACIKQQMGRNLYWYMDYTNMRYFGTCVGNKGTGFNVSYSSDPYWGEKIASIAYSIDKYANGKNGKLSDYNKYTLGFVSDNYNDCFGLTPSVWDAKIYTSSKGNDVLYTGRFGSHYQKDYIAIVLQEVDGRYKIQSTNAVNNNQIITDDGLIEYDFDKSVGFIDKDKVTILNNKNVDVIDTRPTPTYEPYNAVTNLTINNNVITIEGISVIQGMDFIDTSTCFHTLNIYNCKDDSLAYSIVANAVDSNGYSMNDDYNYKYVGFVANIDVSTTSLQKGNYYLKLKTTNKDKSMELDLRSSRDKYRDNKFVYNDLTYRMTTNHLYNYRFELDILDSPFDYASINKPSTRSSLVAYDFIKFDENNCLLIDGEGIIYYSNYDNVDNIEFGVYLVNSKNNYVLMNTTLRQDDTDYKSLFSSSYNLSNISYAASLDNLDTLEVGEYELILKMKNGEYIDYGEFTNRSLKVFDSLELNNKKYEFVTIGSRNKLILKVTSLV